MSAPPANASESNLPEGAVGVGTDGLDVADAAPPPAVDAVGADATTARKAGRGGLAVLGAKAYFIFISFAQQLLLARVVGDAGYGALSRVLAVANIPNNVMIAASVQGVSRSVARAATAEEEARAFRATLRVHVPIAVVMALAFAAFAPVVASFEQAPRMVMPLVTLSGVVFLYGVYGPLVGKLNGTGRFTRQAALDVLFATLRTFGMVALGWGFLHAGQSGVVGASAGFVGAAACIVPLAFLWTGRGKAGASVSVPSARGYLAELVPLVLAQLFTNLLLQVDISLLGRFLGVSASAAHLLDPEKSADEWVGVYRACQLFAFLPYQLLMSITQVLFPMLARAKAAGDSDSVRAYVRRGVRLGTIACGLLVVVVATLPGSLLHFAFKGEYDVRGADTLRVLCLGQAAFAILGIAVTVLASLGRERLAAGITFLALLLVATLCWTTVPHRAFGGDQLFASASATATALLAGLVVAAVLVRRLTGAFGPALTFVRVGAALALGTLAGTKVPTLPRLVTPVAAVGVVFVYLVFLVVTGELGKEDLFTLRSVVVRKK